MLRTTVLVLATAACAAGPAPRQATPEAASQEPATPSPEAQLASTTAPEPPPPERRACTGTPSSALQQQLTERAAQTRSCYERLLQKDPTRQGRVLVKVRMSGAGEFEQATITEDDFSLAEFSECILARFREPTGTLIAGNCVEVNVPFRFVPKNSPPPAASEPKQALPADSTAAENGARGQAAPDPSVQSR